MIFMILLAMMQPMLINAMEADQPLPEARKISRSEKLARLAAKYNRPLAKRIARNGPACPTNFLKQAEWENDSEKREKLKKKALEAETDYYSRDKKILAKQEFKKQISAAHDQWKRARSMQNNKAEADAALHYFNEDIMAAESAYRKKKEFSPISRVRLADAELDRLTALKINKIKFQWYLDSATVELGEQVFSTKLEEALTFYRVYCAAQEPTSVDSRLDELVGKKRAEAVYAWVEQDARKKWIYYKIKREKSYEKEGNAAEKQGEKEKEILAPLLDAYKKTLKINESSLDDEALDHKILLKRFYMLYTFELDYIKSNWNKVKVLLAHAATDKEGPTPDELFDSIFKEARRYYRQYMAEEHSDAEDEEVDQLVTDDFTTLKEELNKKGVPVL